MTFQLAATGTLDLLEQRQPIEVRYEAAYFSFRAGRHLCNRLRRGVEIDEYEGREHRGLDRLQPMRGLLKPGTPWVFGAPRRQPSRAYVQAW